MTNLSVLEVTAMIGGAIAVGSAMPDPEEFPTVKKYIVMWIYRTVKIVTFNLAKEAKAKGIQIDVPPSQPAPVADPKEAEPKA